MQPTPPGTLADGPSLLDQAIAATRQTEPDRAELLLRTLTEEALSGTVSYNRNLTDHHQQGDRACSTPRCRASSPR